MMKKTALLFALFLAWTAGADAQNILKSLVKDVPGQGKVQIFQDDRIAKLVGAENVTTANARGSKVIRSAGYRIQVYAGNNTRQAKNEAYSVATRVKSYFPELAVYTSFNPPRWLCRVGDFRSIEEADVMMRKMRGTGVFKEVSIVREQINIQY